MNEQHDDRLWDPTAPRGAEPADAALARDVAVLERALAPLRWSGAPAPERVLATRSRGVRPRRWFAVAAAAAALWLVWSVTGPWRGDELRPGVVGRRFVAAAESLPIALGELATLTLSAGGELELLHWRADEARFRLHRGRLQADVAAPPAVLAGFLVVEVPLALPDGAPATATIVDRGCRFEVGAARDDELVVAVQDGIVSVAVGAREVWVPAGTSAAIVDGFAATPLFADASPEVRQLVRIYDKLLRGGGSADERRKVADRLVALAAAPHDALPLWHLLADDDGLVRKLVTEGLHRLAGAPDGGPVLQRVYRAAEWLPLLRDGVWRQR